MKDNVLDNPLFSYDLDASPEADTFYRSIVKNMTEAGAPMPSFYTFEPTAEVHNVSYDGSGYTATGIPDTYTSLIKLHDVVQDLGDAHGISFDESVENGHDVDSVIDNTMVFMKSVNGEPSHRMLLGYVNKQTLAYHEYYQFLRCAKEYIAGPDDMLNAYSFIQYHPAFWSRQREERYEYQWETGSGHSSLWVWPTKDEKGNVVVAMEHGSAVEPGRYHHYHDPRLDVYGSGFDDAYIKLAAALHKYFDLSGGERENVDYKPQDWEVEVTERFDAYNVAQAEYEAKQAATTEESE